MAKDYNRKRDNNPDQIAKEFGNGTFIEVIQPNDDFERVTINLIELNNDGSQKCMISTWVDMDEWVTLCTRISCGRFGQAVERGKEVARQTGSFPAELWKRQGGKEGVNGAWTLSIHPATKSKSADVMIMAKRGDGVKTPEGLINIAKVKDKVSVGISHENLENIANMSLMRIQAYINSRQMRGLYDNNRRTSKGQPEYPPQDVPQYPDVPADRTDYSAPYGFGPAGPYDPV